MPQPERERQLQECETQQQGVPPLSISSVCPRLRVYNSLHGLDHEDSCAQSTPQEQCIVAHAREETQDALQADCSERVAAVGHQIPERRR